MAPVRAIGHLTPQHVLGGHRLKDHVNAGTHCIIRIERPMIGAENEGAAIAIIVGAVT